VPAEDSDALEEALFRLLDDSELRERCAANSSAISHDYRWAKALEPLVTFCRDPRRAPDLLGVVDEPGRQPRQNWRARGGLRQDVKIVRHLLADGGPLLIARKALGRLRRSVAK